jgi:two-component system response regulator AdeR
MVVEDEPALARVLRLYLERDGYEAELHEDGLAAWERFCADEPDAVLLDLNVPGMNGLELCRRIRERSRTPILMVTARDSEADELAGLQLGADDYVRKPFSPAVVVTRLRAVLRRSGAAPDSVLRGARVEIDLERRRAIADGAELADLRPKEFELLCALARRPGKVFTKAELQEALYGWDGFVGSRAVDQQVANLRARLPDPALIRTVRGVGYALEEDP